MKYYASSEILKIDDPAKLAWAAIEPIWDDLPLSSFAAVSAFMGLLSAGQKGLISLDWCQKEVRNGGLRQLFGNSTGNLVPWAIDGFHMIGAHQYASILSRAVVMLGPEYPRSASARRKAFLALSKSQRDEVAGMDDAFLALLNSKASGLEKYRGDYVRQNSEQFVQKGG